MYGYLSHKTGDGGTIKYTYRAAVHVVQIPEKEQIYRMISCNNLAVTAQRVTDVAGYIIGI